MSKLFIFNGDFLYFGRAVPQIQGTLLLLRRKGPEVVLSKVNLSSQVEIDIKNSFRYLGSTAGIAFDPQLKRIYVLSLSVNLTCINITTSDMPAIVSLQFPPELGPSQNIWNLAVLERQGVLIAVAPPLRGLGAALLSISPDTGAVTLLARLTDPAVRGLVAVDRLTSRYFLVVASAAGRKLAILLVDPAVSPAGPVLSPPSPLLNDSLVGLHFDDAMQQLALIYLLPTGALAIANTLAPAPGAHTRKSSQGLTSKRTKAPMPRARACAHGIAGHPISRLPAAASRIRKWGGGPEPAQGGSGGGERAPGWRASPRAVGVMSAPHRWPLAA